MFHPKDGQWDPIAVAWESVIKHMPELFIEEMIRQKSRIPSLDQRIPWQDNPEKDRHSLEGHQAAPARAAGWDCPGARRDRQERDEGPMQSFAQDGQAHA